MNLKEGTEGTTSGGGDGGVGGGDEAGGDGGGQSVRASDICENWMWPQIPSLLKTKIISPAAVALDVPMLGVGELSSITAVNVPLLTETECVVHQAVDWR
jgi:hypothetical protein